MIKFFRKIRYDLMEKNKTGRYFKYAIGEIFLVVIGILIALQINNWNENRKARAFEKSMLTELLATLNNDIDFFVRLEDRMKKKDTAIDNLLFARSGERQFTEERLEHDVVWAGVGVLFSYNVGPYEAIKSSGLDKIKTDSLRFKLTEYYEVSLPRANAFLQYFEDDYLPTSDALEEQIKSNGFFTLSMESISRENKIQGFVPKTNYDLTKYLTDPSYEEYLILHSQYKTSIWQTIKVVISKSKNLSKAIDAELHTRF